MAFISYSHEDAKVAETIAQAFDGSGTSKSIDFEFIAAGDLIQSEIIKRLKRCETVVVVVTEHSLSSGWVTYEIIQAAKHGKPVIPYLPSKLDHIPKYLSDIAYADDLNALVTRIQDEQKKLKRSIFGPFQGGYQLLLIIYLALILAGCAGATKVVDPNWWLDPYFGVSVFTFAAMLFVSDVVHEVFGLRAAKGLIAPGLFCSILFGVILWAFMTLPPATFSGWTACEESAFDSTHGNVIRVTIFGSLAYLLTQSFDIMIFQRLTEKWEYELPRLRTFLSTLFSQCLNTALYIPFVYLNEASWNLVLGHGLMKIGIALFGAFFFPQITRYFINAENNVGFRSPDGVVR